MVAAVAKKEEPVEPPLLGVTLKLSVEEASAIQTLLGECSCVGVTSNIYDALQSVGITPYKFRATVDGSHIGTITLEERN